MATTREHAFADGHCVYCPATESSINQKRADGQQPPACEERWITDPMISVRDDFDAIRERLQAIKAVEKPARDPNDALSDFA
jgi:hypothetical protein